MRYAIICPKCYSIKLGAAAAPYIITEGKVERSFIDLVCLSCDDVKTYPYSWDMFMPEDRMPE